MSDKKPEKEIVDLKNESGSEEGFSVFNSALFIKKRKYDSESGFKEISDGVENINLHNEIYMDEHNESINDGLGTVNTPRSNDINYKNCLSSDLLRRLEEGSPIKSTKTINKKTSDINLSGLGVGISEGEEDEMDKRESNRDSHSLFYFKNNQVFDANAKKNYLCTGDGLSDQDEDSPNDYLQNKSQFKRNLSSEFSSVNSTNSSNKNICNYNFSDYSEFLEYQNYQKFLQQYASMPTTDMNSKAQKVPITAFSPQTFLLRDEIHPTKKIEHSFQENFDNNFNYLTNNENRNFNDFFNKNSQIQMDLKGKPNIPTVGSSNSLNSLKKLNPLTDDDNYLTNSTNLSNISRKFSPFNEDIAFYPKNFYASMKNNSGIGGGNSSAIANSSCSPSYSNLPNNTNNNSDKSPNSRVQGQNMKSEKKENFNTFNNSNSNNKSTQLENNDYLTNPLNLNLNINKIKKNANIHNLSFDANHELSEPFMNINANTSSISNTSNPNNIGSASKQYMYGKTGWVCSLCKNFNYESKIKFFNLYSLVRVKCNRCGKPQNRVESKTQSSNTENTNQTPSNHRLTSNNTSKVLFNSGTNVGGKNSNAKKNNNLYNKDSNSNSISNSSSPIETNSPNSLINDKKSNVNNYDNNVNKIPSTTINNKNVPAEVESEEIFTPSHPDLNEKENKANPSDSKKKKKPFVERVGDWVCIKCKNLNFSFRVICNRCQLTKIESEKLFEQYMKNLMNYVKINELLQNQILSANHSGLNNNNQNYGQSNTGNTGNTSNASYKIKNTKKSLSQTQLHEGNLFSPKHNISDNGTGGVLYNKKDYYTEEKYGNNSK